MALTGVVVVVPAWAAPPPETVTWLATSLPARPESTVTGTSISSASPGWRTPETSAPGPVGVAQETGGPGSQVAGRAPTAPKALPVMKKVLLPPLVSRLRPEGSGSTTVIAVPSVASAPTFST